MKNFLNRFIILFGLLILNFFQSNAHLNQTVLNPAKEKHSSNDYSNKHPYFKAYHIHFQIYLENANPDSVIEELQEEEETENSNLLKFGKLFFVLRYDANFTELQEEKYKAKRIIPSQSFSIFYNQSRCILFSLFRI